MDVADKQMIHSTQLQTFTAMCVDAMLECWCQGLQA